MEVKAKIVSVDQANHSVVVRYYTDILTEDKLATSFKPEKYQPDPENAPDDWLTRTVIARSEDGAPLCCRTDRAVDVVEVPAPTGQALLDYITKRNPPNREWLELMEKVSDPAVDTSMSGVDEIVGVEFVVPAPAPVIEAGRSAVQLRARRTPDRQIPTIVL